MPHLAICLPAAADSSRRVFSTVESFYGLGTARFETGECFDFWRRRPQGRGGREWDWNSIGGSGETEFQ
jgi:hypothetical protein